MVDFLDAVADGLIQNLAGIKYTHYDLEDLQLCLHYGGGKYNILFGRDQYLLAAVALGVRGAVGSTYNFMGDTMARILSAFDDGSASALAIARATQLSTASLIKELDVWGAKWPGMYGLKVMENLTAVNVGPGRLPFLPTSDAAKADLKARVKGWCATLPAKAAVPQWCGKLIMGSP
jgi:N-acetylneuraminate lyase